MDWTLIAGIGLTIWATLILLSNERSAMETVKRVTAARAETPKPKPESPAVVGVTAKK